MNGMKKGERLYVATKARTRKGPKWTLVLGLHLTVGSMMRQADRLAKKRAIRARSGWPRATPMAVARSQSPSPTQWPLEIRYSSR